MHSLYNLCRTGLIQVLHLGSWNFCVIKTMGLWDHVNLGPLDFVTLGLYDLISPGLTLFDLVWPSVVRFGNLGPCEQLFAPVGPFLALLTQCWPIRIILDRFVPWPSFVPLGPIWSLLAPSGPIWPMFENNMPQLKIRSYAQIVCLFIPSFIFGIFTFIFLSSFLHLDLPLCFFCFPLLFWA